MIINYSRNNRKKYFFQGRETTKIEDTNSSATERSREPQPKEKTSKNGCHMTRNLVLTYQRISAVAYICFLHGPIISRCSQHDSDCRAALTTPLPKVIQSFPLPSYWLQEFIPLSHILPCNMQAYS